MDIIKSATEAIFKRLVCYTAGRDEAGIAMLVRSSIIGGVLINVPGIGRIKRGPGYGVVFVCNL